MSCQSNGLPEITQSKPKGVISKSKMKHDSLSNTSNPQNKSPRKKSPKKIPKKKSGKLKKKPTCASLSSKEELPSHMWKENSQPVLQYCDISQKSSEEVINNAETLDPDVLRWENCCDNLVDEMNRIEIYKGNRRLRYINARNNELALLAIKEQK